VGAQFIRHDQQGHFGQGAAIDELLGLGVHGFPAAGLPAQGGFVHD